MSINVLTFYRFVFLSVHSLGTGPASSVGCASACYAHGRGFGPPVRQPSLLEIGHEIISTSVAQEKIFVQGRISGTIDDRKLKKRLFL